MSGQMTPGKRAGLNAISNPQGVIAAAALDQRVMLRKSIGRAKGIEEVTNEVVSTYKEIVTEALTKQASAILLDTETGLSAARRRNGKGLIMSYEFPVVEAPLPRFPQLYDNWSVKRLKEIGADAIKILLHYYPFDTTSTNERKHVWIERVGDECRANDIPFVLEFLVYDNQCTDENSLEYARRKPELVTHSLQEFSKDRYGVDLLKIEFPLSPAKVEGPSVVDPLFTQEQARELFRNASAATQKPFVYLSAGARLETYLTGLELAVSSEGRFNGVLCGRAVWQDAIPVFAQSGAQALEAWIQTQGVSNLQRVQSVITSAQPWHQSPAMIAS